MLLKLSSEIWKNITSRLENGTYFRLAISLPLDRHEIFREGGLSIILGTILDNILIHGIDEDILISFRRYLPHQEIPLIVAVSRRNKLLLQLVCRIWENSHSDYAYMYSFYQGFFEGIELISHTIVSPNEMFFIGQLIHKDTYMNYLENSRKDTLESHLPKKLDYKRDNHPRFTLEELEYIYRKKGDLTNYIYLIEHGNLPENKLVHRRDSFDRCLIENLIQLSVKEGEVEKVVSWLERNQDILFNSFYIEEIEDTIYRTNHRELIQGLFFLVDAELYLSILDEDVETLERLYEEDPERISPYILSKKVFEKCSFGIPLENKKVSELYAYGTLTECLKKYLQLHGKESLKESLEQESIDKKFYLHEVDEVIYFGKLVLDFNWEMVLDENVSYGYFFKKTFYYPPLLLDVCNDSRSFHMKVNKVGLDVSIQYSYFLSS